MRVGPLACGPRCHHSIGLRAGVSPPIPEQNAAEEAGHDRNAENAAAEDHRQRGYGTGAGECPAHPETRATINLTAPGRGLDELEWAAKRRHPPNALEQPKQRHRGRHGRSKDQVRIPVLKQEHPVDEVGVPETRRGNQKPEDDPGQQAYPIHARPPVITWKPSVTMIAVRKKVKAATKLPIPRADVPHSSW